MKSTKHDSYKKQQLTEAASQKIVRKRRWWFAIAISAFASLVVAISAFGLTPANGGSAGGTTITIDNGPGDQTDPHVNGNLAVYTTPTGIRYYDFVSTIDSPVPTGAVGTTDILADVFGSSIAFSRLNNDGSTSAMVYDTATHVTTEIAPGGYPQRFGPVLGGSQIAFTEIGSGNGDIMVFDLSTIGPLINVSVSRSQEER